MAGPEATVERASVRYAKQQGCLCLKLLPSLTGLPDRLVLIPMGHVIFVEFKSATGRLSLRQRAVRLMLTTMGFKVCTVRDFATFKEAVDSLLY